MAELIRLFTATTKQIATVCGVTGVLVACEIACRPLANTSEMATELGLNRHTVGRHIVRMKKLGVVLERGAARHRKKRTIVQELREGGPFVEIESTFVRTFAILGDALGMLVVLGAMGEGTERFSTTIAQITVTSNCSRKTAMKLLGALSRARLVHLIRGERPHFTVVLKGLRVGLNFASS